MNNIQHNIAAVNERLAQVKSHPMCAEFSDDGARYTVIYPAGMCLDGVLATHRGCGKIVALDRLLDAMERHWKESGI